MKKPKLAPKKKKKNPNKQGTKKKDFTLHDGFHILREISEHRVSPLALTQDERMAVVAVLIDGQHTAAQVASFLKTSPKTIQQDIAYIRTSVGKRLQKQWNPTTAIGHLYRVAEKYTAEAFKNGDIALAWSIQRDLIRSFKELGILTSPQDQGFKVTIESIGQNYDKVGTLLSTALNPRLTGEQVEEIIVEGQVMKDRTPEEPRLRLPLENPNKEEEDETE